MKLRIAIIAVAVVLLASAAGATAWFFRGDAPAEVSLSAATDNVTTTSPAADASASAATTTGDGISGTWAVDTETGDFDYESATGSFAGFRIQEELASIGSTTAVGRTGDVTGTIEIDGTTVTTATFGVDLTTITTNERRRDDKVQQALETGTYPTATFTLTEPIELGADAAEGSAVEVTAVGDLTIHGTTQPVELGLSAQLTNGTVVVVGSLDIAFADFGVQVPQSRIVVSVEDHGVLELQLLLVRDGAPT